MRCGVEGKRLINCGNSALHGDMTALRSFQRGIDPIRSGVGAVNRPTAIQYDRKPRCSLNTEPTPRGSAIGACGMHLTKCICNWCPYVGYFINTSYTVLWLEARTTYGARSGARTSSLCTGRMKFTDSHRSGQHEPTQLIISGNL